MKSLVIATRQSPLALWQAEFVKSELQKHHPELSVSLNRFTTKGDQLLNSPLSKIGGKGLFVKELEVAILNGGADIAVHSMKDVPMSFPKGLELAAICEREDPRDALISCFDCIDTLPKNAIVGTSSLRRKAQIASARPDLVIKDLRGNVNTRLGKLDNKEYDAIILAAAGLKRLGFQSRIQQAIDTDICLPAVGQGAVGIECLSNNTEIKQLLAPLNHHQTDVCVTAERALNKKLEGGCQVPIACFATLEGHTISMRALVASIDGKIILRASGSRHQTEATTLGIELAEDLLQQGAAAILVNL